MASRGSADLVSQLGEVWDSLLSLGRSLDDVSWHAPTACPGWDVAAQYAHIVGTESVLAGLPAPSAVADSGLGFPSGSRSAVGSGSAAGSGSAPAHLRNPIGSFNEAWVSALASTSRQDVLDQLASVVAARRSALATMSEEDFDRVGWTPIGEAPYRRFMQIRVFDCWVHEQDVREATGRPGHETGPAAEQALDEIVSALGYLVGKKAGAPDGSLIRFALDGPLRRVIDVAVAGGRAAVVAGGAGEAGMAGAAGPTVTITLTSTGLTRLACGRLGPESVDVAYSGDADLGARVVANLAFTI